MADAALAQGNTYSDFIREVFIDPIRTVMVVDDEFPTLDTLLTDKLGGPSCNVHNDDCERVRGILEFCRDHPRNWLVDIHDGGKQANEIEVAGHLSQSDLLILDYQLIKGDHSGDRAIEILRKLAENDRFNLVVVYTQAASAGDHGARSIVEEIALGLTSEDPELALHPQAEEAVNDAVNLWSDTDHDIEQRLFDAVDEGTYLNYRKLTERGDIDQLKEIGGIAQLLSILETRPDGVRLREPQLVKWTLKKRQDRLRPRLSPRNYGRVNFRAGSVGKNWVRTDRMFVTVVGKDTSPGHIPELVLSALGDWDPAPHRLLMSKMRAELDKRGVPVEAEVLGDLFLQAGWLEEFLEPDEATRNRNVRNAVRRHWESMGDQLEADTANFAHRLSQDIRTQDKATLIERFSGLDLEAHRQDILLHLNCHNCSKRVEGTHLSTGHIIRLQSGNSEEYKLCLSPACDLEPEQKRGAGFHKRLGDWMPFTAVSLLSSCFPKALRDAAAGSHLFFKPKSESKIRVFSCAESLSEPMFAANQGRFSPDGAWELELARIRGSGSKISSELVTRLVVGQLRYEYALNLLHRLGHHLSRVGLDFKALPKTDEDLG